MKNLALYVRYDLGTVAVLVGLPLLVLIILRRRTALWRALFAAELVLIFVLLGNCFVPGSCKDFWISESVDFGLAAAATCWSWILSRHSILAPANYRRFISPQIIALIIVTALIALRVCSAEC